MIMYVPTALLWWISLPCFPCRDDRRLIKQILFLVCFIGWVFEKRIVEVRPLEHEGSEGGSIWTRLHIVVGT